MAAVPRAVRPHVLGVDDAPFDKRADALVPIVGVMMEGADLVEAVAVGRFPVDGDDAAGFLAQWISGLRFASALHAVVLGGVTLAGLAVVDVERLAGLSGLPVLVVNRHDPQDEGLAGALRAAGLADRVPAVERTPRAFRLDTGLWVAHAGTTRERAEQIVLATRNKSQLPEPLRVAHLIGAALVAGQSRGRP
jgi:endonuclease V-like protein UPF0215 family